MRRMWVVVAAAMGAAVCAAGCATSGFGTGVVVAPGKPEAEGDALFTWRADADARRGTIRVALPDGRVFSGNFLQVTSTTVAQDLGTFGAWGGPYGWGYGGYGGYSGDYTTFARQYSGRVIAQLEGPAGERMRCSFQLARPEDGPQSGGVGDCELSSGERISYATLRGLEDGD